MDTQPPQPGESGSKAGQLAGATSNTSLIGTQHERRHKLAYRDAADVVPENIT